MTGSGGSHDSKAGGIFNTDELAVMQGAIEAVCAELGIKPTDSARREAVAGNVMRSWSAGGRMPLNLVAAGLDGAGATHDRA